MSARRWILPPRRWRRALYRLFRLLPVVPDDEPIFAVLDEQTLSAMLREWNALQLWLAGFDDGFFWGELFRALDLLRDRRLGREPYGLGEAYRALRRAALDLLAALATGDVRASAHAHLFLERDLWRLRFHLETKARYQLVRQHCGEELRRQQFVDLAFELMRKRGCCTREDLLAQPELQCEEQPERWVNERLGEIFGKRGRGRPRVAR